MPYTDCHLHLPVEKTAGLAGGVVAGITPDDWQAVLETSSAPLLPALGVHPWHVAEYDLEETLGRLEALLRAHPGCSVGEVGLDGCPNRPAMSLQRQWCHGQLSLAVRMNRPAVLHLVRAWDDAIATLREFPSLRAVVHGFHGSAQEARRLLDFPGIYLSLGFDALTPGKRFATAIRAIPPERLLVDSDAPYRGHDSQEISALIQAIAQQKGLAPEALATAISQNFHQLFPFPIFCPV